MNLSSSPGPSTSERLTTVLSYGALLLLGYLVFRIVEPFLVPLVWSAVLSIFFGPLHKHLARKMSVTRAALVSTTAVVILLIVPAILVLFYATREAFEALAKLQSYLVDPVTIQNHATRWLYNHLPHGLRSIDISDALRREAQRVTTFLGENFTALLKNIIDFFVALFICIFALFFMFRDGRSIVRGIQHLLPFDEPIQQEMLKECKDLVFASLAVAVTIAALQGLLGALSFSIVHIHPVLFWSVLIGFFSLVPVVGSALVWGPAALWLGVHGNWGQAVTVIAISGGGAAIVDNIVRPLLLSNRTRLNELLLFLSVLGGVEVFGLVGLVIGPIIVSAAMGVFRVYMERRERPLPAL